MNNTTTTNEILASCGGVQTHSLQHIFEEQQDDNSDNIPDMLNPSLYYSNENAIDTLTLKNDAISVLSLNCQSLNAKIDELRSYITMFQTQNYQFSVICLQETWLDERADVNLLQIPGYNLITHSKICSAHGGLAIYIREGLHYRNLTLEITNSATRIWEGMFIEITIPNYYSHHQNKKIIVGNIYRPPRDILENYTEFISQFDQLLTNLQTYGKEIVVAGDFNIDLLKIHEKQSHNEFLETVVANGFVPKIIYPTRFSRNSGSLIDNFFCKLSSYAGNTVAGILLQNISDHQPYFLTLDFPTKKEG